MVKISKYFTFVMTMLTFCFPALCNAGATGQKQISSLVLAADATPALEFAAKDLRECLSQVTGREFTAVQEADAEKGSILLRVAEKSLGLAPDEWLIHFEDKNFVIEGGSPAGIVWGIYDFLERSANCLWLDRDTTVIPVNPDFVFPTETLRVRPAVYAVEVYTGMDRNGEEDAWLKIRNRENTWNGKFPEVSAEFGSPRANHTLVHYAEGWTDPTFFGLDKNGNRKKMNYCLTNPQVRQAVAAKLKEYIRADRAAGRYCAFYDVSQNDTGYEEECFCPECTRIAEREGSYSGVLIDFLNAVSREVRAEFPEVTISTLAYNYTLQPPAHLVADDNIVVRMCGAGCWAPFSKGSYYDKSLQGWKKHAAQTGIWDYAKHYDGLEFPYIYKLDELPDAIRNCREFNVRHYFFEYENPLERSFAQLQWWLMLHLATNPDRDFDELVNKFLAGYYGEKAAPVMRQYLDYLLRRQKETGTRQGEDHIHTMACYLDDEFYRTADELLARAEELAGDNELHARHVRREHIPVDLAFHTLTPNTPENQTARSAAFERYARCSIETKDACPRLDQWQKDLNREQLSLYAELEKLLPLPVPEQFQGKTIVDISWKDFTRYGSQMQSISPDPDGLAGRTWGKPRPAGEKTFSYPVNFTLTDFTNTAFAKVAFTEKELPPDGKYHWLAMGTMNLPNNDGLLVEDSGLFELMLCKGGVGIIPEPWEVWAHIKVSGPDFGGDPETPNAIFCDRIICVKPEKP